MHIKNFCLTVAIAVAWVTYTATVVLSAPVTPIPQTSQDDSKQGKQEQCQSGIARTGNDIVGASSQREALSGNACVQQKRLATGRELQPYTAMMALEEDGMQALLGFPCSRSMGCSVAAVEPLSQDGKNQWPILTPGLVAVDTDRLGTAFTSMRHKSLMYMSGEEGTKLTLERDAFIQIDSVQRGWAADGAARTIFWDRLLNFGPLLLLFLEKLLGRL
jgi:hypothetical protein